MRHGDRSYGVARIALLVGIVLALLPGAVQAAWNAGNYLKFGVGARPLSMGNAFVAIADDATAVYWNPAGLTLTTKTRLFVSYAERFGQGVIDQNAGVAFHWRKRQYLGFAVSMSSVGGIKSSIERDGNGRPIVSGTFDDNEVVMMGSFGYEFSDLVSFGVTGKYFTHELNGKTASGVGADIGFLVRPLPLLTLGLNAQNINRPRMKWQTETDHFDRVPANYKLGGAYFVVPDKLRVSADINVPDSDDMEMDFGAEYTMNEFFSMRGGIAGSDLGTGASVGWQHVRLDYAFRTHDIGDTHRFALHYEF